MSSLMQNANRFEVCTIGWTKHCEGVTLDNCDGISHYYCNFLKTKQSIN